MMQYDSFNEICSQGTQTKLSTSSKDDVLVSFTSTCSLLSSTFSQFLLEVSRLLQIPIDKQNPLISVDKLLSEFKERSLELHNIDTTELSFHSPLIPTSPQSSSVSPPRSNQGAYLSASLDKSNSDSIPGTPPASPRDKTPSSTPTPPSSLSIPCSVPSLFPQPMMTNSLPADTPRVATRVSPLRLPVVPVPAKITKEQADSTNRITPPLPLNEMCIGNSSRSAFCKPAPKLVSPTSSVSSHTMTSQIKLEPSTPPANTKNETELLECLQKLQNCYEKYLTPPTLPFSLNSILHDIKPRQLPDIKPPVFKHLKPSCFEGLKPLTLESLKLPLPSTFQFLDRAADPNAIIKAMQERNPLLNAGAVAGVQPRQQPTNNRPQLSPLFSSPMKCPYCNLTFHKKSHLSNHLVQLHSLSYHCCRQCKISFPDRQSLEHHQRSHPKQQFQCTGCNLSFKTGSELKRHVKTHTQERAFMCDICGSRFNLKHNLKAHMRQHTGERPFRCKICNRGFTRSNNLKRHLYAHCSAETTPQVSMSRTGGGAADQVLSMIPNMVMFDGSRLHSIPVQNEVKVD